MKFVLLASALVFLVACKPSEEQQRKLKNSLPENCEVKNIGSYGSIDQLVLIICDDHKVTSTHQHDTRGKSHYSSAAYVIEKK